MKARVKASATLDRRQRRTMLAYLEDAAGNAWLEQGRLPQALAALGKAGRVYQELPDKTPLVNNLMNRCRVYINLKDMDRAESCLEQGLAVAGAAGLSQLECDLLYRQGLLYAYTGREEQATRIFGKGLLLAQRLGNHGVAAAFLSQFGQQAQALGDLDRAGVYFEQAKNLFELAGDKANLLVCYGHLNQLYRRTQNYPAGLEYARAGLELARRQGNRREENVFWQDIALLLLALDDRQGAWEAGHSALELARQQPDRTGLQQALETLAQVALARQDWDSTERLAQEGYDLALANSNLRRQALFLNTLAELELARSEPGLALTRYAAMARLFLELKDWPALATLYLRMAEVYLDNLNDPDGLAGLAQQVYRQTAAQEGQAALYAFTAFLRLVQRLAGQKFYRAAFEVVEGCLADARRRLQSIPAWRKSRRPERERWLLFMPVLAILAAVLRDMTAGRPANRDRVNRLLQSLQTRYDDSFGLIEWTAEMYARLTEWPN